MPEPSQLRHWRSFNFYRSPGSGTPGTDSFLKFHLVDLPRPLPGPSLFWHRPRPPSPIWLQPFARPVRTARAAARWPMTASPRAGHAPPSQPASPRSPHILLLQAPSRESAQNDSILAVHRHGRGRGLSPVVASDPGRLLLLPVCRLDFDPHSSITSAVPPLLFPCTLPIPLRHNACRIRVVIAHPSVSSFPFPARDRARTPAHACAHTRDTTHSHTPQQLRPRFFSSSSRRCPHPPTIARCPPPTILRPPCVGRLPVHAATTPYVTTPPFHSSLHAHIPRFENPVQPRALCISCVCMI